MRGAGLALSPYSAPPTLHPCPSAGQGSQSPSILELPETGTLGKVRVQQQQWEIELGPLSPRGPVGRAAGEEALACLKLEASAKERGGQAHAPPWSGLPRSGLGTVSIF